MDNLSPLPQTTGPETLNLFQAMEEVLNGRKITKLEWNNRNIYCLLAAERLCIFVDDKLQDWLVKEADMRGNDWVVLSPLN